MEPQIGPDRQQIGPRSGSARAAIDSRSGPGSPPDRLHIDSKPSVAGSIVGKPLHDASQSAQECVSPAPWVTFRRCDWSRGLPVAFNTPQSDLPDVTIVPIRSLRPVPRICSTNTSLVCTNLGSASANFGVAATGSGRAGRNRSHRFRLGFKQVCAMSAKMGGNHTRLGVFDKCGMASIKFVPFPPKCGRSRPNLRCLGQSWRGFDQC